MRTMIPRRNRYVRKGDFLVPEENLDEAERVFHRRSKRSRATDKAMRAPITSVKNYRDAKGRGVDYPGVDTPDEHPRRSLIDYPGAVERSRIASGAGLEEVIDEQPRESTGPLEQVLRSSDEFYQTFSDVWDSFKV